MKGAKSQAKSHPAVLGTIESDDDVAASESDASGDEAAAGNENVDASGDGEDTKKKKKAEDTIVTEGEVCR